MQVSSEASTDLFPDFLLGLKDSIKSNKKLFNVVTSFHGDRLVVSYALLQSQVTYFNLHNDVYSTPLQMRKGSSAKLNLAGLEFSRDRRDLTLTIDYNIMNSYMSTHHIVHKSANALKPGACKVSYTPDHIEREYPKSELISLEDTILKSAESSTSNPIKQSLLVDVLCRRLKNSHQPGAEPTSTSQSEDLTSTVIDSFITDSVTSYLHKIKMKRKGPLDQESSLAKRTVISAVLFNYDKQKAAGVSLSSISKRIDARREYLAETLKLQQPIEIQTGTAVPNPNFLGMDMNVDDDDDDSSYRSDASGVSNTSTDSSFKVQGPDLADQSEESGTDSGSEVDDSGSTGEYDKLRNIMYGLHKRRKVRSDKKDTDAVYVWWHNSTCVQYDTNSSKHILCRRGDVCEYHKPSLCKVSTREAFICFKATPNMPDIGYTLFKRSKPACIRPDKYRKCVDVIAVRMRECEYTLRRLTELVNRNGCGCPFHIMNNNTSIASRLVSVSSTNDTLLCPPVNLGDDANRSEQIAVTKEDIAQVMKSNVAHANAKIQKEISSSTYQPSDRNPKKIVAKTEIPSRQDASLIIHPYTCVKMKCKTCIFGKLKKLMYDCPTLRAMSRPVTLKKYIENKYGSPELMSVEMSVQEFIKEYNEVIKLFIPHYWNVRVDHHMRRRLIEELPMNAIAILTDFSANLELVGQDTPTCGHFNSAIQAVFVVTFKIINALGQIEQYTEVWSLWGDKLADKVDNTTAFHAACMDHILAHYRKRFDEESRMFDTVFSFSDGSPYQYKNRYNAAYIGEICDKFNLNNIVHTLAPTANFKCCVDAAGADTKKEYRDYERAGVGEHCSNAYMVYKMLSKRMRKPEIGPQAVGSMQIADRHFRYVCHADQLVHTKQLKVIMPDPHVIVYDSARFRAEHEVNEVKGIRSQFQIRSERQGSDDQIVVYCRPCHCQCVPCIALNYDQCVLGSYQGLRWWSKALKVMPLTTTGAIDFDDIEDAADILAHLSS